MPESGQPAATPQGGGGGPKASGTPSQGGPKPPKTPSSTPSNEKDVYSDLKAGENNKWAKDLKSADLTKPDEKATKGNEIINNFDYQTHSGIKYDEHTENKADLSRVDIDCTNINNRIYTLGGAITPIYNVALTKAAIKSVLQEGFLVRPANDTKQYYLDNAGDVKIK